MQAALTASVRDLVSPEEWQTRVDLAALYRLTALYGWDDLIFTHISARVPGSPHHFLINPFGFLFEEITASSLVKVDAAGNLVMDTPHFINPAGFTIHSAVHEGRPDANFVMHTHTIHGVAVAAQSQGLLPISQQSLFAVASIGYHGYEGLAVNDEEKPRLIADLGSHTALILKNHGLLTVGKAAPDAFLAMYTLESACRIQVLATSGGALVDHVPQPVIDNIMAQAKVVTKGVGAALIWPGLLRKLDRRDPSYKN